MEKERWSTLERLIDRLLDAPVQNREKIIHEECGDDQELKSEVIHFLQSIDKSDNIFDKFSESKNEILGYVKNSFLSSSEDAYLNRIIAKYRVLEKIGSGGMGVVFLAERCDGVFNKRVAIKLMLQEFVVPEVEEQFNSEIQILANLKHPGIARLIDGGIFEELPYLVMEYVDGKPIDQYCDDNLLTISERVELFISVLEIIKYAHNNLVVHRDLKPDNIFIDREGNVKILDFGIAKLEKENKEHSLTSSTRHFYSPKFASPEQMHSQNVSVQSDIFSAGLLLQKLLTDKLPYDLEKKSIEEIRIIKSECIQKTASQKLSLLPDSEQKQIAAKRKSNPQELTKILAHEIDEILLKAQQSNPNKRYSTAADFINDLKAWQNGFPVCAIQSTTYYRSTKFLKRNRKSISLTAAVLVLLSFLGIHSLNQIKSERNIALTEVAKAEEMSAFLIDLFEVTDPTLSSPGDISARELLTYGLKQSENIKNSEIRAGILTALGNAFTKISDYETAENILSEAVDINKSTTGNSIALADAMFYLGINHSENVMWHLALPEFKKAHSIYSLHYHSHHDKILNSLSKLGLAMLNTGNPDSAGVFIETAYDRMRETGTPNSSEFLKVMKDYAYYHAGNESYEEAIKYYEAVIEGYIDIGSTEDYRLAKPYNELASIYKIMEDYPLAEEYYKKSLDLSIQKYGEDHLFTKMVRMNLITPLFKLEKFDEAESYLEKNIEILTKRFSEEHWRTGGAYGAYGLYSMRKGEYEKADSLFRKNLGIYQEAIGPDHIWTAYAEGAVSAANRLLNNHSVADSLFSKHLAVFRDRYPDFNNDHRNQLKRLRLMYMNNDEKFKEIIEEYTSLLN